MKDQKKAEIKRVLMGRAVLGEDGRLAAVPAGALMRTPIGLGDGADAVIILGVTRRIRRYATKDGKARVTEAAAKSMQNIGRGLALSEQPEATACLVRYLLTRPAVLVFTWEDGVPTLTAWTGRGLTGWISLRRAIGAFEKGLPASMTANEVKPSREKSRKAEKEEKKRQKAEKKTQREAKKATKRKRTKKTQPSEEPAAPQSEQDNADELE